MSFQNKRHTSDDTGSFKKSRSRDDPEASSPVKKLKKNIGKKKTRAQLNKIWENEHDDFIIPYLADLARQRFKVDKIFKASSFNMVARAMNKKFEMDFSGPNVANIIKSLRAHFMNMCNCFNINGVGWDEGSKTITLDPISYVQSALCT